MSKIFKYEDFLLENLLLESVIRLSPKFKSFLKDIFDNSANKIADSLLNIDDMDRDIEYNYIDISDKENDLVKFIPAKKADDILSKSDSIVYKIARYNDSGAVPFLPSSEKNKHIYDALGVELNSTYSPEMGDTGDILGETISEMSGRTYCLFKNDTNGNIAILNKNCFDTFRSAEKAVWNSAKNKIKIGRVVRSILNSTGYKFTDSDIEKFVNKYKSRFDVEKNAMMRFNLVMGKEIAHWYNQNNYHNDDGTLGSSCMKDVDTEYFDIYVYNPKQVNLLVLHDESGTVDENGKYSSKKIKGRALVWHCDNGDIFMDRVYSNADHDVELFIRYAKEHGWWYKEKQETSSNFHMTNGSEKKSALLKVKLGDVVFNYYPYLDTLSYINTKTSEISNSPKDINANREILSTSGGWDEIVEDEDEDECGECGGYDDTGEGICSSCQENDEDEDEEDDEDNPTNTENT